MSAVAQKMIGNDFDRMRWNEIPQYTIQHTEMQSGEFLKSIQNETVDWSTFPLLQNVQDISYVPGKIAPETSIQMCWDDEYLYVRGTLHDENIWGTMTDKNSTLYFENDFEVFLNPDGSHHNYYELEVNCLNTIWELVLNRPYKDGHDLKNPCNLQHTFSKVSTHGPVNDPVASKKATVCGFWTVDVAIAFKDVVQFSLYDSNIVQAGDVWSMNFSRVQWQLNVVNDEYVKVPDVREDNWVWAPTGIVDIHRPEIWGRVTFQKGNVDTEQDMYAEPRKILTMVYYDQCQYHDAHQNYARDVQTLYPAGFESCAFRKAMVDDYSAKISIVSLEHKDHDASIEAKRKFISTFTSQSEGARECHKGYVAFLRISARTFYIRNDSFFWHD